MKRIWNEFLTFLAFAFLIAFSIPAFNSSLADKTAQKLNIVQWICWIAFAIDLALGILLTSDKKNFLKKHPLEIASTILPFLRPLRILRVISFGSLALQKIAIGRQVAITIKVVVTTIFITYISAIQITISERVSDNSNIKSFGDGLWWAITTVTTVGYGDRFPTTTEGRFLAVLLMVTGISLVGVITASVAAWFVRISQNSEEKT